MGQIFSRARAKAKASGNYSKSGGIDEVLDSMGEGGPGPRNYSKPAAGSSRQAKPEKKSDDSNNTPAPKPASEDPPRSYSNSSPADEMD